MLKFAVGPAVLDADIGVLDLLLDPLLQDLLLTTGFIHILYELIVVGEIGAMGGGAGGELDDCHYVAVAFRVFHDERPGDLTDFHPVDLQGNLLGEVGHLELSRARTLIYHHAAIVARILILRVDDDILECEFLVVDVGPYRVEPLPGLIEVIGRNLGAQKDVAAIDAVAALLDELDDMESILRLDNLGHLFRVVEVEGYCSKFGIERGAAYESELSAAGSRAFILGVKDGESREGALSACHALAEVAQTGLDILDLLSRDDGIEGHDLHLDLKRNGRDTVLIERVEVAAHIVGRSLYIFSKVLLYLADALIVARRFRKGLADLGQRFAEILLDLLLRADIHYQGIDVIVNFGLNHRLGDLDRVNVGLMEEKFLDSYHFGNDAIGVAIDRLALIEHLLILILDFRLVDRLVADNPGYLFRDIVIPLRHRHEGYDGRA